LLAEHLSLHPTRDLRACMDNLAERRALSCLEELVRAGVPRAQLSHSFNGLGGDSAVDFKPEGSADTAPLQPPPPFTSAPPEPPPRVREEEADLQRRLQLENEELRRQLATAQADTDNAGLYEQIAHLKQQTARLSQELETEGRRWDDERRQMRDEADRGVREEAERHRAEIRRLSDELGECRRRHQPPAHPPQRAECDKLLTLADVLPRGFQLGSLKRAEWQTLFAKLVAELVRRRNECDCEKAPPETTYSYTSTYDLRSEVDRLWDSVEPMSPRRVAPVSSYSVRRDADDFLRWGAPSGSVQPPPAAQDADAFLRFGEGRRAPQRPYSASADANAFLRYSSPGGGTSAASVVPPKTSSRPLASDANAFMGYLDRK
jgi:hypothetical protein